MLAWCGLRDDRDEEDRVFDRLKATFGTRRSFIDRRLTEDMLRIHTDRSRFLEMQETVNGTL